MGEYLRANETYQEHLRIIGIMDAELNTALKRIRVLEKENAELKVKREYPNTCRRGEEETWRSGRSSGMV